MITPICTYSAQFFDSEILLLLFFFYIFVIRAQINFIECEFIYVWKRDYLADINNNWRIQKIFLLNKIKYSCAIYKRASVMCCDFGLFSLCIIVEISTFSYIYTMMSDDDDDNPMEVYWLSVFFLYVFIIFILYISCIHCLRRLSWTIKLNQNDEICGGCTYNWEQ